MYKRYVTCFISKLYLILPSDIVRIKELTLILWCEICYGVTYFILLISYDGQNGVLSSKSNGKDNKFEENFLIICEYFNFVKNMLFSLKYVWNGTCTGITSSRWKCSRWTRHWKYIEVKMVLILTLNVLTVDLTYKDHFQLWF
jgi:hypothetical protein